MCCLFGLLDYTGHFTGKQKNKIISILSVACEERGTDATGISYNHNEHLTIFKRPLAAHKMRFAVPDVSLIMGHTRMTTQGDEKRNYNNHPFYGKADNTEFTLAHNGVLFLDELPEFSKTATEALRQPLEDGVVTVTRAVAKITFPSSFMLVCAMNPCKCGYFGDPGKKCTCSPQMIKKYLDRVSGPLLDRIDIEIELPSVSFDDIAGKTAAGESSDAIRARVNRAREFSRKRFQAAGDLELPNAKMTPSMVRKHCKLDEEAETLMRDAFDSLGLSARGHDRVLRVARTIADLDGDENINADHIAEAIMYRSLDRKYWRR